MARSTPAIVRNNSKCSARQTFSTLSENCFMIPPGGNLIQLGVHTVSIDVVPMSSTRFQLGIAHSYFCLAAWAPPAGGPVVPLLCCVSPKAPAFGIEFPPYGSSDLRNQKKRGHS